MHEIEARYRILSSSAALRGPRVSTLVSVLVFLQALSCGDGTPTGPGISDEVTAVFPLPDGFDVPLRPEFAWSGPDEVERYELHLGPTRSSLTLRSDSLEATSVRLTDALLVNHEYFWRVVGRAGSRTWRGPVWRFVTINPGYRSRTRPEGVVLNLYKAWQARDTAMYDSLLHESFVYVPSPDDMTASLDRETDLRATRNIFESARVPGTSTDPRADTTWVGHPSTEIGYPPETYYQIDYRSTSFGFYWLNAGTNLVHYRLPTVCEVRDLATFWESGARAFLRPGWVTAEGDTIWKIARYESYFIRPDPPGVPQSCPPEPNQVVRYGWGQMKAFGLTIGGTGP